MGYMTIPTQNYMPLQNYQNYGMFKNLLNGNQVYINTLDITKNTWNDYFNPVHSLLLDGIETDLIQSAKIKINIANKCSINLSLPDLWLNLIAWRLIIYTDQIIQPKHIFFEKVVTRKELKKYIDNYCIEPNKRTIPNPILNGIISDCLTEISKIDNFSYYLANTFNVEDFISLMNQNKEFGDLMHPDISNVALEDVKSFGDKNVAKMIEIMEHEKISNTNGKDYNHCLTVPLLSGEGINVKQFREFAVIEGTKPNNEGGIFPYIIPNGFINGGLNNPYEYYIDANAARQAQILQKENVGTSGRFARLLGLNNIDTMLYPDENYDCHTKNFVEIDITSERVLKMFNSRYYRMSDNGVDHLIDIKSKERKQLIGKKIKLRSPCTCASAARGKGFCYKCYGTLAYVNKHINPGRYASEKLSAELTQRLLSAKHLLETSIKKMNWCVDFDTFMEVNANIISLNQENIIPKNYYLVIDPDDIDYENEDSTGSSDDDEEVYNEYITKFYIKTSNNEEIPIYADPVEKMFISNELNGIIRSKAIDDNGRLAVPLSELQKSQLFYLILHNNDLMKALEDVTDCIDKNEITRGKGMTIDKLVNRFVETIIISNLSIQAVHLEVILANQIRAADDVLEKPEWEFPNAKYQILTLKQALDKHPSITVSLIGEHLKNNLYSPLTFAKHKPSFIDLFFMPQPQMFIKNDDMIDGTVEYVDYGADDKIQGQTRNALHRVAKKDYSED